MYRLLYIRNSGRRGPRTCLMAVPADYDRDFALGAARAIGMERPWISSDSIVTDSTVIEELMWYRPYIRGDLQRRG